VEAAAKALAERELRVAVLGGRSGLVHERPMDHLGARLVR
jgi:hypothetical protein